MKPFLKTLGSFIITLIVVMVFHSAQASGKKVADSERDNWVTILEEDNMLLYGINDLEDNDISKEKPSFLLNESSYEKRTHDRFSKTEQALQIPSQDFVWHLFIQSLPVTYIIKDDSLHILEIL